MRELCTPPQTGCTVETLGQYPSVEAEIASIDGLKKLFLEAERYGKGKAVDEYVIDGATLVAETSDPEPQAVEVMPYSTDTQEVVSDNSKKRHTRFIQEVLSIFDRFSDSESRLSGL